MNVSFRENKKTTGARRPLLFFDSYSMALISMVSATDTVLYFGRSA